MALLRGLSYVVVFMATLIGTSWLILTLAAADLK